VLKFKQATGDWTVGPYDKIAVIYLHFIGPQESLFAYILNADCFNAKGEADFFVLKWQALDQHKQWVDISKFHPSFGKITTAQIIKSPTFTDMRLVFIKKIPSDTLIIKDLQVISH
jgi:hypothetical protein